LLFGEPFWVMGARPGDEWLVLQLGEGDVVAIGETVRGREDDHPGLAGQNLDLRLRWRAGSGSPAR